MLMSQLIGDEAPPTLFIDKNKVFIKCYRTEAIVHNETSGVNKQNVDLTQVLLSNQMLIKKQAELIKSMFSFVGQDVSENSQDESDELGSYGMDKLDEMSVVNNDDVDPEQAGEDDLEVFNAFKVKPWLF
jgi:hypothetical protein